jgi:hypothetical protein
MEYESSIDNELELEPDLIINNSNKDNFKMDEFDYELSTEETSDYNEINNKMNMKNKN